MPGLVENAERGYNENTLEEAEGRKTWATEGEKRE